MGLSSLLRGEDKTCSQICACPRPGDDVDAASWTSLMVVTWFLPRMELLLGDRQLGGLTSCRRLSALSLTSRLSRNPPLLPKRLSGPSPSCAATWPGPSWDDVEGSLDGPSIGELLRAEVYVLEAERRAMLDVDAVRLKTEPSFLFRLPLNTL